MRACLQPFLLIIAFGGALCFPVGEVQAAQVSHLTTARSAAPVTEAFHPQAACHSIIVAPGDWLRRIAARLGTSWQTLYAQNRATIGPDPNHLIPGEHLQDCGTAAGAGSDHNPPSEGGEPCLSHIYWPSGPLTTWATPPGCYASDYRMTAASYPRVPATFGGCDWWPRALHPTWNIWTMPKHATPKVGAVIWFAPGEQGAGKEGHWGVVVAISANGRYALSSEMNFTIVGRAAHPLGGWGRAVYRYVALRPPATLFVY